MLQEDPSMANDTDTFAADNQGKLLSSPQMLVIRVPACEKICGSGWAKYPDAGPRLMTWLVPVVVLTLNLQYAAIGKERFLTVLHLFGDPIHSTWSLLAKVETWRQCYRGGTGRSKNEAVIIAAIQELVETLNVGHNVEQTLQDVLIRPETQPADFHNLVANTASKLADCRVNQTMRTWASIVLYLIQVVAALVPKLGQATSPSGGRIGMAMLLSWLLPVVLLSNAVGDFTSRKSFLRIMLAFMEQIESQSTQPLREECRNLLSSLRKVDKGYFKSLAWSGAIYTYRPNKTYSRSALKGYRSTLYMALISTLPVIVAFVTAFLVLYKKPTYFSCRHFFVLAVFGTWLLSPLLTWMIGIHFSQQRQWQFVLAKDAVFGFPILALIIASSCGFFNSCWCWSGVFTLGKRKAAVYLTDLPEFDRYNQVDYPAIIVTCLALQLAFFLLIRWIWRRGFNLLAWSEQEKEAAFLRRTPKSMVVRDLKAITSVESTVVMSDSDNISTRHSPILAP